MARSGDCNLAMVESRSVGDELVNSDLGISSSWMKNSSIRFSTTTSSSITARASFQSVKKAVTINQIISSLCRLFTVATAYLTSKRTRSFRGEVVCDLHLLPSPNIKRVGQLNIFGPTNFKAVRITNSSTSKISGCGREEQSIISSRRHLLTRVRSVTERRVMTSPSRFKYITKLQKEVKA